MLTVNGRSGVLHETASSGKSLYQTLRSFNRTASNSLIEARKIIYLPRKTAWLSVTRST